jgi:hypothetical protein
MFSNPFALPRPELVEGSLSENAFPVRLPCLLSKEAMFFNPFALSLSKGKD